MDEALVANWNDVVKDEDTVWNLGDFAFCCGVPRAKSIMDRLNGEIHHVLGNHDEWIPKQEAYFRIKHIYDGLVEIDVEGQQIVLCHYALREWHHDLRGVWHLFGHTHAALRPRGKSVDVGVDNVAEILGAASMTPELYRPVSFAEVKSFMDARPIGPHVQFAGGFTLMNKQEENTNAIDK
jgi:calcineurin-like phosphoesterase family protein